MRILHYVIGLVVALLLSALGAVATPIFPVTSAQTEFSSATQVIFAKQSEIHFAARAPPLTSANVAFTGAAVAGSGNGVFLHGYETHAASLGFGVGLDAPNRGPRITIRDHYNHHNDMRNDVIGQLEGQGYRIADGEASFGSACGTGRCRPDILYEGPDGKVGIIEIKTGNADLSIRQTEIFPQINSGDAIPRGAVAQRFGLDPGVPLRDQGYPNGIPIEVREFPGAGQ